MSAKSIRPVIAPSEGDPPRPILGVVDGIRLLVTDVDGTLLDPDGLVMAGTASAIRLLHRRGVHVCLATGRIPRGIRQIVDELGLRGAHITMHGGLVVDPAGGDAVLSHTLEPEQVDAILAVADDLGQPALFCYPDGFKAGALTTYIAELFLPYNEPLPDLVPDPRGLRTSRPHKIAIWTGDRGYDEALIVARTRLGRGFAITSGDNRSLELLPAGIDKGRALVELAAFLGIRLAESPPWVTGRTTSRCCPRRATRSQCATAGPTFGPPPRW